MHVLVLQVNPDMLALGPQKVTAVLPVLLVSIYHHVLILLLALVSPVETAGTIQAHTGLVVQAPLLVLVQLARVVPVEAMWMDVHHPRLAHVQRVRAVQLEHTVSDALVLPVASAKPVSPVLTVNLLPIVM